MSPWYLILLLATVLISASGASHSRSNKDDKFLSTYSSTEPAEGQSSAVRFAVHRLSAQEVELLPKNSTLQASSFKSHLLRHSLVSLLTKYSMKDIVGPALLFVACVAFFGAFFLLILRLLLMFRDVKDTRAGSSWLFQDYVAYRFAYWITWSDWSYSVVMCILSTLFMLIGTVLYRIFVHANVSLSAWKVFLALLDPGGGRDEKKFEGAFVCGIMSVAGLAFFALALTFCQQRFEQYMHQQTLGMNPVMEKGHVVVIGLTGEALMLLQELADAYSVEGGVAIAVLSEQVGKPELEEKIRTADLNLHGSRIIVRAGHAQSIKDLQSVAVSSAKRVILMANPSKEKELKDAFNIQSLIAMRSQGWPEDGRILVECAMVRNKSLFERLGGDRTDIVMTDYFVSELFIQLSAKEGLGSAVINSFSFQGSVFHVCPVPEQLVGKQVIEAAMHYPAAVPVGAMHDSGRCEFGGDFRFKSGENILLLAENSQSAVTASAEPFCKLEIPSLEEREASMSQRSYLSTPETIFIFGVGTVTGVLLVHLDYVVPKGTRVVCVSRMPKSMRKRMFDRSQRRWRHRLQNISKFEHVVGSLGSPMLIDDLRTPLEQASRIFVLSELDMEVREADALAVATIHQVRSILSEKASGVSIPIITEIRDTGSEHLCGASLARDYIDTAGLPLRFLACVAYQHRLQHAIEDMLSATGEVAFNIHRLDKFLPRDEELPSTLSFTKVQEIVFRAGSVALGWSAIPATRDGSEGDDQLFRTMTEIFAQAHGTEPIHWAINPSNKTVVRRWDPKDYVIVLEPRAKQC